MRAKWGRQKQNWEITTPPHLPQVNPITSRENQRKQEGHLLPLPFGRAKFLNSFWRWKTAGSVSQILHASLWTLEERHSAIYFWRHLTKRINHKLLSTSLELATSKQRYGRKGKTPLGRQMSLLISKRTWNFPPNLHWLKAKMTIPHLPFKLKELLLIKKYFKLCVSKVCTQHITVKKWKTIWGHYSFSLKKCHLSMMGKKKGKKML